METLRVALVQNNALRDVERNLLRIEELFDDVSDVDVIALPEVFAFRGEDQDLRDAAEPLDGPLTARMADLARQKNAWILAGSVLERAGDAVYNTSVLLDRTGSVAATYRKIHLFEAHLGDGRDISESRVFSPGISPVLIEIEEWRAGLSICYDLRFPEMYRRYADENAHLLFVPANFTHQTGRDHWKPLLRARAIENQCFVVAPNQCGTNEATGVTSYGHSLAIGPWGEILCEAEENEGVITAELHLDSLRATRQRLPALEHRVL